MDLNPVCCSDLTYPSASVQANVDCSLEEDVVTLREFERFENRLQTITVIREKVLEQDWVHGTSGTEER